MVETVNPAKYPKFVRLTTAYTNPQLYGDISQKFIDYTPGSDGVIIEPMPEVAINICQVVDFNELKLTWHPWVRLTKSGEVFKVYLVAEQLTQDVLFGRNESGWKDIVKTGQMILTALGNRKFGAKGVFLTKAIYDAMPLHLRPKKGHCLVLSQHNSQVSKNRDFLFLCGGQLENMGMYFKGNGLCSKMVNLLPIVELPKDILIKVGSEARNGLKPETSLRIKLPKKEETSEAK